MENIVKKKILDIEPCYYVNKTKIYDIKRNPSYSDLFSFCDLEGKLTFSSISDENSIKIEKRIRTSKDSIQSISYFNDGERLLIGTTNRDLSIIQNYKFSFRKKKAHKQEISQVKTLTENLFVSGDYSGAIKIWDTRQQEEIFTFNEQSDEISGFEEKDNYLVATSIDGTLGVYDLRSSKKYELNALSDFIEDELTCVTLLKYGKKVLCGTSEGPIVIFQWDWFGDYKDRLIGHPSSILTMVKYNENYFFTGCDDGNIRLCQLEPKNIGFLINDKFKNKPVFENESFNEIHCLDYISEMNVLLALTNLNVIKAYNVSSLDGKLKKGEDLVEIEEENNSDKNNNDKEENEVNKSEESQEVEELDSSKSENGEELSDEKESSNEESESDSESNKEEEKENDNFLKIKRQAKKGKGSVYDSILNKEKRKEFFSDL